MTGAPLPVGADAIVMVEDTEVEGQRISTGQQEQDTSEEEQRIFP